jgi:flagellar motor switch protein FliM
VLIQVEGKNKFLAQLGQFRGSRALRITRMCQQIEAKDAAAGERK